MAFLNPQRQKLVQQLLNAHEELLGQPLIGLLKTASQSIVSPGIIDMKRKLYNIFPFQDLRGSWFIHYNFEHPEFVVVSHHKSETYSASNSSDQFIFQWNQDMLFDLEVSRMLDAHFYVSKLEFGPSCNAEFKEQVKINFSAYMLHPDS